jgi:hypothetical protein
VAIGIDTVMKVSEGIKGWFTEAAQRPDKLDDLHSQAIGATNEALAATLAIFADVREGIAADREREEQVGRLWLTAAEKCQRIDVKIAEIWQMKGLYWSDPAGWSANDLDRARTSLDNARRLARDLLTRNIHER